MIADFNKKQKIGLSTNKIAFQIAGVLFFIIIIVLIVTDIKIYQKRGELVSQINNYQKQIEEIKKSSQNLKDDIANSNNQDYIEKIAYEQLGEQKPGEKEIIFISPPKKAQPVTHTQNSVWSSWLSGAWNWLKSKI